MSDRASDAMRAAMFEEVVRLVCELGERLSDDAHLPAIATIQGLIGRASDLGEMCGQGLTDSLPGLPAEPEGDGTDNDAGYL